MTNDHYQTDMWLMRLFTTYFDPCPLHADFDGLKVPWSQFHDQIFVNPPYSNPLPWVKKTIEEYQANPCTIVMLLRHDSSTEWWRLLHEAGAHVLCVVGRLKYQTNNPAPFPSVLVVLS